MGKHKHKHKQQQPAEEVLTPQAMPAAEVAKERKTLEEAWESIDFYFNQLWADKPLRTGQWYDFQDCLEIAKSAMQTDAIREYTRLKLLYRAKKRTDEAHAAIIVH